MEKGETSVGMNGMRKEYVKMYVRVCVCVCVCLKAFHAYTDALRGQWWAKDPLEQQLLL